MNQNSHCTWLNKRGLASAMTKRPLIRDLLVFSPVLLVLGFVFSVRVFGFSPASDHFELHNILFLTLALLVRLVGFVSIFSLDRATFEKVFWILVLSVGDLLGFYLFYIVRLRRSLREAAQAEHA
jgi:hypothetical protein